MNAEVDMMSTITPKSDQLNADDLIGGPRTVTITGVRGNDNADQPVSISFEGDNSKPFKPCKSMRRVMVSVWGADAKQYVGRSMTLYCDPDVQFGGMAVGGIRISHMSHIDKPQTMALTATRAKRKPYTVHPLAAPVDTETLLKEYAAVKDSGSFADAEAKRAAIWKRIPAGDKEKLKTASEAAKARLTTDEGDNK